jgi:hypothetical protein
MLGKLSARLVAVFALTVAIVIAINVVSRKPLANEDRVVVAAVSLVMVEAVIWMWKRLRKPSATAGERS